VPDFRQTLQVEVVKTKHLCETSFQSCSLHWLFFAVIAFLQSLFLQSSFLVVIVVCGHSLQSFFFAVIALCSHGSLQSWSLQRWKPNHRRDQHQDLFK
jgi:hypothetical protein